jgi:hypothetical protein
MKIITNLFFILFICFIYTNLYAQHLNCESIQQEDIFCDIELLNGFTATMPSENSPGSQPNPLCPDAGGGAHNISWIAFVAPHEGNYSITLSLQNCVGGPSGTGVQTGIFTDCTFVEYIYCEPTCSINDVIISSSIFSPGDTYYLFIDGCNETLCDYTITVDGAYSYNYPISGTTYIDYNADGIQNGLEPELGNVNIALNPGNLITLSDNSGNFSFENVADGTYTVTGSVSGGEWVEDEISIEIAHTGSCIDYEMGFVPSPNSTPEVLVSITNSIARCDGETKFFITIQNISSIDMDASFEFEFDDLISFVSSDIPGVTFNGNILMGTTGVLEAFEVKNFLVTLQMPPVSDPLPELEFAISVFDEMQTQIAEYVYSDKLRCSYDPNDKKEYPDREGDENLTLFEEDLEYKIRFQNNGNDTAFVVKILDELDPNIEPTSIRLINSSHPVQTSIEDGILQFLFENIFLVDSTTNYDASQGFVTFRCNVKDGIAENTPVVNSADIIFDSNPPIITNSTLNTFVSVLCTNKMTELDVEICDGETFNGYTESGTYTEIIPLEFDCDSTVVIHLDVQGITYSALDITACEGKVIVLNEVEYTFFESQKIIDTTYNANNCISNILEYDVFVFPKTQTNIATTICEGMDYFGLDSTGIYTIVDVLNNGCDSLTIIDLIVIEPELETLNLEACDNQPITISGIEYIFSESTELLDTLFDASGCISVLTSINVNVNPTITVLIDTTICDGMDFYGLDDPGTYTYVDVSSNGCDSITLIELDVIEAELGSLAFEVCQGDSFLFNDIEYTFEESTEIMDTLYDSNGCISILTTINITVSDIDMITIDTTICEGYSYLGFTETGEYSLDSINENGCFDLYTIQLTVLPLTDPACIVGTDDYDERIVKIYPNPVSNVLFVEAESQIDKVSIYSTSFQKVTSIELSRSKNKIEISTQELNQGLYIIVIETGGKVIHKKLIVE